MMLKSPISESRFDLITQLNKSGVGTSIHYPKPIPEFTYYQDKYKIETSSFPNAASIGQRTISLPVGPHLNLEDMEYIIIKVKEAISNHR